MRHFISVILPVYNGMDYLALSVESVLEQDFQNFELLIVDDRSTDNSYAYLQNLQDARIRLFRNESNKGLFYNLNFLIGQSSSPLIKLWAQDDIMYPNCLAGFISFHQQHPGLGFSYSARTLINETGAITETNKRDDTPEIITTELHARIAYNTGSIAGNIANVCISKAALDKVGLFKETMKISADFDMWVRLAEHYDTGFIRKELIMLRDHSGQLSRNEKYYINHVKEDLEVYRYLDSYLSGSQRKEGHAFMRQRKLLFYYTLMIKTLLKGRLQNFTDYFTALSSFENMGVLSWCFFKRKILKRKKHLLKL